MTPVPDEILTWVAASVDQGASVRGVEPLRRNGVTSLVRLEVQGHTTPVVVKCGPTWEWRSEFACEAAALRLAAERNLPAPRLLAAKLNDRLKAVLVLSYVPGSTDIPVVATSERLCSVGRVLAQVHKVALLPSRHLPYRARHMPWIDFALWRRLAARYRAATAAERDDVLGDMMASELRGWSLKAAAETLESTESTPLLDRADELLRASRRPVERSVFVHGDLWQGNAVFENDRCVGLIDWEAAGAGDPGVDVGSLRWDAAILFGVWACDEVLAGWEDESASAASDVAYWDVVAALNTSADMAGMTTIHEAGRRDLDAGTLVSRRDEFLDGAMSRLAADPRA